MGAVDRIAELMLRRGDAQAAGVANRGQVWGGVAKNLAALPAQVYQQKQADTVAAQEAEQRAQQIAASKAQVGLAGQQNAREQTAFEALTPSFGQ